MGWMLVPFVGGYFPNKLLTEKGGRTNTENEFGVKRLVTVGVRLDIQMPATP